MRELNFQQRLERMPILKIASVYIFTLLLAPRLSISAHLFQSVKYGLFAMTAISIFCYLLRGSIRQYAYPFAYYFVVLLFGIWQYWHNDPLFVPNHFSHFKLEKYVAKIVEEPKQKQGIIRFSAELQGGYSKGKFISVSGIAKIALKSGVEDHVRFGDRLCLKGSLQEIPPPFNPLEFDYREYLKRNHIFHQMFVQAGHYSIVYSQTPTSFDIIRVAQRTRRYFLTKLRNHFKDEKYFMIAAALLYGFRGDIGTENLEAFTNTGTIHVLSVSGMHVAVLFGFLSLLFKRIPWPLKLVWVPFVIIASIIWIYTFVAGLDPPIVRAAIMISFVLCGQHFKRNMSTLNVLLVAAVVILLIDPRTILDIGFQLSFLAVLGILLFLPIFEKLIPWKKPIYKFLRDTLGVSIAAQILTTPLALYYFGQFPTYFLIANLLVDLPSTLAMYIGFVMTINPFAWLNEIFGYLLEHIIIFMLSCLKFIAHLSFSTIKVNSLGLGLLFLSYFAIFSFIYAFQWKDRRYGWLAFLCLIGIVSINGQHWLNNRDIEQFRVYNTKKELTIGYFKGGSGIVYSTFDSLHAGALQYACGREIQLLGKNDLQFVALDDRKRENYILTIPLGKIVVLEHSGGTMPRADLVIVRKNLSYGLARLVKDIAPRLVILDGSNSMEKSLLTRQVLDSLGVKSYLMKDNFAYVWNKESL